MEDEKNLVKRDTEVIPVENTEQGMALRDFFKGERDLLEFEYTTSLEFYKQIKEAFDDIIKRKVPGTLRFVTEQTKNLISMRSHLLSVVKEIFFSKKSVEEMVIKLRVGTGSEDSEKLKALLQMIMKGKHGGSNSNDTSETEAIEAQIINSERLLEDRVSSGVKSPGGYNPAPTDIPGSSGRKKKRKKTKSNTPPPKPPYSLGM